MLCLIERTSMSSPEDEMIELEVRDSWWEQGEAVMREMCDEEREA